MRFTRRSLRLNWTEHVHLTLFPLHELLKYFEFKHSLCFRFFFFFFFAMSLHLYSYNNDYFKVKLVFFGRELEGDIYVI